MEEKEILLKTIEGLNASIASLSTTNKNQSEQIKNLQERIKELTAQVAWLNRQLFGRKSEKLRVYDPNMPDLFADEFSGLRQQAEEKRDEAVEKIEKVTEFADSVGLPIVGEVPRSDEITRCEDRGMTVVEGEPESPAAQAFLNLAKELLENAQDTAEEDVW